MENTIKSTQKRKSRLSNCYEHNRTLNSLGLTSLSSHLKHHDLRPSNTICLYVFYIQYNYSVGSLCNLNNFQLIFFRYFFFLCLSHLTFLVRCAGDPIAFDPIWCEQWTVSRPSQNNISYINIWFWCMIHGVRLNWLRHRLIDINLKYCELWIWSVIYHIISYICLMFKPTVNWHVSNSFWLSWIADCSELWVDFVHFYFSRSSFIFFYLWIVVGDSTKYIQYTIYIRIQLIGIILISI